MSDTPTAPPIGIMPKRVWESRINRRRIRELSRACFRYADAHEPIPLEWILELDNLLETELPEAIDAIADR